MLLDKSFIARIKKIRNTKNKISLKTETALQRSSKEKVFWKHAENLQENTHAKVWFQ